MNKKYVVRLSEEERMVCQGSLRLSRDRRRSFVVRKSCSRQMPMGRVAGCQDCRGLQLPRANDRESPQTPGHRKL